MVFLNLNFLFDYRNWKGIKVNREENFDYSKLDLVTLCLLLAYIYRADRFGFFEVYFKSQIITKIIKAIKHNFELGNTLNYEGFMNSPYALDS